MEGCKIQNITGPYSISRRGEILLRDKEGIKSDDCNAISFKNQGTTNVKLFTNGSPNYELLKPGESVQYGSNNPNSYEVDSYKVVFTTGVGNLFIQREYNKAL